MNTKTANEAGRRVPLDSTAFETVAAGSIEATWDDVAGLATPLAARVPVQVCGHPNVVQVHPDMSVTLGVDVDSRALGLVVGKPDDFPDIFKVTRRLGQGYLPILESRWENDGIRLEQTVLTYLPHDQKVVRGDEMQYVVMRVAVTNAGAAERKIPLFVYLGCGGDDCKVIYQPFTTSASRWANPSLGLVIEGSTLSAGTNPLLVFSADGSADATFSAAAESQELNNVLRFDINLASGETRTLDFVMADSADALPADELANMQNVTFDNALALATQRSDEVLAPAMKLTTPDARINEIYKAVILSSLSLQFRDPVDRWQMPRQTVGMGVWSWEFAHMAVPMMSIGYWRELDDSLRFFTERQNGVGPRSGNITPRGEIKSTRGSFTGQTAGHNCGDSWQWMNETGSILWALAERFRYSRDVDWLKKQWPSIMAAWDWVQSERQATRITGDNGEKVRYWGLLPAGMSGDVDVYCYQFTFNDGVTWLGMSEIATAAREAGFAKADRLEQEVEEYRNCILDVVNREEFVDPETNLRFIPNIVFYRETPLEKRDPYWCASGPVQLFDIGLLDPSDERFADMVEHTRLTSGILLGMAEHIAGDAEWYPNQTERSYFRCYLHRGEIEKALLVLFSNLQYGMSNDTYQTTERFHVDDANFTAFNPNASGNGRDIDMLRRMVIDEQAPGELWLLRGCPRRWFQPGESIVVENATTLFGSMAIRARSEADCITVDITPPDQQLPQAMTLVVRCPVNRPVQHVTIDGQVAEFVNETVTIPCKKGPVRVILTR